MIFLIMISSMIFDGHSHDHRHRCDRLPPPSLLATPPSPDSAWPLLEGLLRIAFRPTISLDFLHLLGHSFLITLSMKLGRRRRLAALRS